MLAREIRDGTEGTSQVRSVERGVADEGNLQAALDTLLAAARGGDAAACEARLRMCGDLLMYWHIRGKNLTAREYATSLLDADAAPATAGRAALFGVLLDSAQGFATPGFDTDSIVAGGDDQVFPASRNEEPAGQGTDSGYFGSWLASS